MKPLKLALEVLSSSPDEAIACQRGGDIPVAML